MGGYDLAEGVLWRGYSSIERLDLPMTETRILLMLSLSLLGFFGALPATYAAYTPLETMNILLWEDSENERTTATVFGFVDPELELPVEVKFYFVEGYELNLLDQMPADVTFVVEQNALEFRSSPAELDAFENLVQYSFILTEGHSFVAGFSIDLPLFEIEMEMGNNPLALFTFVPPNDLEALGVGFVAPSIEHVGAGRDVVFIADTDEGEVYGIIRENVPGDELQEFVIAFGSRESRDAALAAAMGPEETTPTALDWFTTPVGMVTVGSAAVLLVAVALFIVVMRRGKGVVIEDDDDFDGECEFTDDSGEDSELADEDGPML